MRRMYVYINMHILRPVQTRCRRVYGADRLIIGYDMQFTCLYVYKHASYVCVYRHAHIYIRPILFHADGLMVPVD